MHHNIKELTIWQKSIDLAVEVYEATASFPSEEKYGLTSQIRKSAVSIPSNIAEGAGRNSNGEFLHFLGISHGSSYELQTQLIISNRLKLMGHETVERLLQKVVEIQKMNYRLKESLSNTKKK